jgi:spore maturation protein CgeB
MRFVLFYHSLVSDWNHGNAHFLRGVAAELMVRGHDVQVLEPQDGWSLRQLIAQRGTGVQEAFERAYPGLRSTQYGEDTLDLEQALDGADVVIAHEWNTPELLHRLTRHRARLGRYQLLFHDTHHRAVSAPDALAGFPIDGFDGVLAYGASLRDQYQRLGWGRRVWVWHEAADTRVFRPVSDRPTIGDVVWIGNWGDDERAAELREFFVEPVAALRLRARVHGVRYPPDALQLLADAGIDTADGLRTTKSLRCLRASGSPFTCPAVLTFTCCPGFPQSVPSRRWPVVFPWSPRVGMMWKDCSRQVRIMSRWTQARR